MCVCDWNKVAKPLKFKEKNNRCIASTYIKFDYIFRRNAFRYLSRVGAGQDWLEWWQDPLDQFDSIFGCGSPRRSVTSPGRVGWKRIWINERNEMNVGAGRTWSPSISELMDDGIRTDQLSMCSSCGDVWSVTSRSDSFLSGKERQTKRNW